MVINKTLSLPHEHLNLRRNPFGRLTREEKNELVVLRIDLSPYIERLKKPGYAVQFLKEGARNKTTHLLAIRRHFPRAPYIRLYEGEPAPPFPQSPVLFIDWFHALPKKERGNLLGRPSSFAIVSHMNHSREFRRAKLNYDLIKLPAYTFEQLTQYIDGLIKWATRNPNEPIPTFDDKTIARLRSRFDDDDDAINSYLYELFETLEQVGPIEL